MSRATASGTRQCRAKHRPFVVGRFITVIVLTVVFLLGFRYLFLQGLIFPVRVVSGSMAPSLYGPHWILTCQSCDYPFACGQESPPPRSDVCCPNCGFAEIEVSGAKVRKGERVVIDLTTPGIGLRRWDPIAAWDPQNPRLRIVKRIVGLPGESVSIRDGDIYVDGRIARKSVRQQRATEIVVWDARYLPKAFAPPMAKMLLMGRWKRLGNVFTLSSEPADEARDELLLPNSPDPTLFLDHYSYNQGVSRHLHHVFDLSFRATCRVYGDSTLVIRAHDGWSWWEVKLAAVPRSAYLHKEGRHITTNSWDEVATVSRGSRSCIADGHVDSGHVDSGHADSGHADSGHADSQRPRERMASLCLDIVFIMCDCQIVLTINDKSIFHHCYPPKDDRRSPVRQPLTMRAVGRGESAEQEMTSVRKTGDWTEIRPLGGEAQGESRVDLAEMIVSRDIHYLGKYGREGNWSAASPLAIDEYLLVGDNIPLSVDGRLSEAHGIVSRKAIIGRVLANKKRLAR